MAVWAGSFKSIPNIMYVYTPSFSFGMDGGSGEGEGGEGVGGCGVGTTEGGGEGDTVT